jgi:hypothetical protein
MLRARSVLGLMGGVVASFALVGCSGSAPCGDARSCAAADASAADTRDDAVSPRADAGVDAPAAVSRDASPDVDIDAGAGDAADAADAAIEASATADARSEDVKVDTFVCDLTQPPSASPCVLDADSGVFVAPTANGGSDTVGNGTSASPYATLSHALASLGAASRVYVCDGAYTDQVTVTSAVAIFGGLSCGASAASGSVGPWAYVAGAKATIHGASPAFALEVNAGSAVVDLEDLEIDAAPGTSASPSSVAVFATTSTSVTLRRTTLVAAPGFEGASGTAGAAGALVSAAVNGIALALASPDGQPVAAIHQGGPATTCTCSTGATSVGGEGASSPTAIAGESGLPAQSTPTPASATGAGGTEGMCTSAAGGVNGSNAMPLVAGDGLAATLQGAVDSTGWHPADGAPGVNGGPGQGGGGGGLYVLAPGGRPAAGGACGGCGGVGGGFGAGAGGSIALVAYDAPVQLIAATLTSSTAGAGGNGAVGGAGIAGGVGGAVVSPACAGGAGGAGAAGGLGAGGAGGVSIGILYQGVAPTPDTATQIGVGAAGIAGIGGDPGKNDGLPGVSANVQNAAWL